MKNKENEKQKMKPIDHLNRIMECQLNGKGYDAMIFIGRHDNETKILKSVYGSNFSLVVCLLSFFMDDEKGMGLFRVLVKSMAILNPNIKFEYEGISENTKLEEQTLASVIIGSMIQEVMKSQNSDINENLNSSEDENK